MPAPNHQEVPTPLPKLVRRVSWRISILSLLLLSSVVWCLTCYYQPSVVIQRGPFLQSLNPHACVIAWRSTAPSHGMVLYGLTSFFPYQAHALSSHGYNQRVCLHDLQPDTFYSYRVLQQHQQNQGYSDYLSFNTPSEQATELAFLVFGDCWYPGPAQYQLAQQMQALPARLLLNTGDIARPDKGYDYDAALFTPFKRLLSRMPFYPVPGNTDVSQEQARYFLDTFQLSQRYYSFTSAHAFFVALDSNLPRKAGTPIYRWLVQQLRASQQTWKFVFFHHPPYSPSGREYEEIAYSWQPLFERYGVDLVFCGHDHFYARLRPIRHYLSQGHQVIYIITGGGGAPLEKVTPTEQTACCRSCYHFLHIVIKKGRLTLRAIDARGQVFDHLVLHKSP